MSYTEIIKFNKKGESSSVGTVKNASRGAFVIWNYFAHKYLGRSFSAIDEMSVQQEVWDLFRDNRLSENEKIILGSTYDYVLIKKEDIPRVISAYTTLNNNDLSCVVDEYKNITINLSLSEQSEILQNLLNDKDCIAVGWHQNSVSCDMWNNYNCINDTEHWFLFDNL